MRGGNTPLLRPPPLRAVFFLFVTISMIIALLFVLGALTNKLGAKQQEVLQQHRLLLR